MSECSESLRMTTLSPWKPIIVLKLHYQEQLNLGFIIVYRIIVYNEKNI